MKRRADGAYGIVDELKDGIPPSGSGREPAAVYLLEKEVVVVDPGEVVISSVMRS